jgi:acetyltransferase
MSIYRLNTLLAPGSVAVVGGSARPRSIGRAILRNIKASGFAGDIGLVNPRHPEIEGLVAVDRLAALPFVPELAIVTSPASTVPEIISEAAQLGVAGAIVVSTEFKQGPGSVADIVGRVARDSGMRLLGPNCLGMIMPRIKLNASFSAHMPRAGNLGLISQSGAIAGGMIDWGVYRNVGFSGVVLVGDQLDVDIADLLDFFALDQATKAILVYVEEVKNARKFMSAARAAARVKPVVVIKPQRPTRGGPPPPTTIDALADPDSIYDAAFLRAGILRVFDLRELFDGAATLSRIKGRIGNRLAILTNDDGIGVLALDRLSTLGGVPARITPEARSKLDDVLPPHWSGTNPVDLMADADPARYVAALKILLAATNNDAVLVLNLQTGISDSHAIAEAVAATIIAERARRGALAKPVLAVWVGGDEQIVRIFAEAQIPFFSTEDDAVRGFMHVVRHGEAAESLTAVPPSLPQDFVPDVTAARRVVEAAIADGRSQLDPGEVRGVLGAYQIDMVPTLVAADADAAADAARSMIEGGDTVVLKLLSRDIPHKSDVGGVVLNLTSVEAVRAAARRIVTNAKEKSPAARLDGFVVQPMILRRKARELIVGIADDPTFGAVLVFGHGGTAVELIDDKALALPPLDLKLARDLVARTRIARLLQAYRDVPAVKADAVELTLVKLAQLAADIPEVRELGINPLLADETGVLAIDARIAVGAPAKKFAGSGGGRFAVRPYPSQWIRRLVLDGDWRIVVRPIRPEDEPLIHDFVRHVSIEDLRLRFFAAIKEFSHEFVARLTQLDYARAMAFIALDEASGEMLGVVRIHSDSIYESGEYAILLRSDLKGRGLGWALMQLMIEYARAEGLNRVEGDVLQENTVMLAMCRSLGFEVTADPVEHDLCHVRLDLDASSLPPRTTGSD